MRFQPKSGFQRGNLAERGGVFAGFHGGDHHVFGRVLGRDELKNLRPVALRFEQERADAVGQNFGLPFFQDPVFEDGRELVFGGHVAAHLFVAARRDDDHFGVCTEAARDGEISCRVACMERDEEVERLCFPGFYVL